MRNRVDANQREIIRAAEKMGASVIDLSQVGGGIPDILIGYRGKNYLIEIKNPETGGCLSDKQSSFVDNFRGDVRVIYDVQQLFFVLMGKIA